MNKIITELSEEMNTRKRQWRDLARTYEQFISLFQIIR